MALGNHDKRDSLPTVRQRPEWKLRILSYNWRKGEMQLSMDTYCSWDKANNWINISQIQRVHPSVEKILNFSSELVNFELPNVRNQIFTVSGIWNGYTEGLCHLGDDDCMMYFLEYLRMDITSCHRPIDCMKLAKIEVRFWECRGKVTVPWLVKNASRSNSATKMSNIQIYLGDGSSYWMTMGSNSSIFSYYLF